jgi:drug/metabolite transporter (DMT)-like permease
VNFEVVLVVLVAAITHATWNALTHTIKDGRTALFLVGTGRAACGALIVLTAPPPATRAWPYLAASVAIHIAYQILLIRSFQLGDFGQMYPVARGTSPLAVTMFAGLALGQWPHGWNAVGAAIGAAGLIGLAVRGVQQGALRGDGRSGQLVALGAALVTGLAIASYTVVDGVGVRDSGPAPGWLGYVGWLMACDGSLVTCVALCRRHDTEGLRARISTDRALAARGCIAGALSVAAYGLVLWAQSKAQLALVAVLRESSVFVAAAIASLWFKEKFGLHRAIAGVCMVSGIMLMIKS